MSKSGVISIGVKAPIIRQGDNLKEIVVESVSNALDELKMEVEYKDVIAITESVVARAQNNYVTIDDIVQFLDEHNTPKKICLYMPIFSRNRFSMILKAFARYADEIIIVHKNYDEQGNPCEFKNPFTGIDMKKYYEEICKSENCNISFYNQENIEYMPYVEYEIDARCHPICKPSLKDIMNLPVTRKDGTKSGYNIDWGLLGSNKANEETLKLFPQKNKAQELVDEIQHEFGERFGKQVEVMVYGDGCFCSPYIEGVAGSKIWEYADPITAPAATKGLEGSPNEVKIKQFADDKYKDLDGEELENAIKQEIRNKNKNLVGKMDSQGTTPRKYIDLLASLCDLTTGSGDKGCPITVVKHYFNNYSD